jgi:lipopolysaccharide/colanic/teichoic acid biosynthesis glycosyltransferase
VFSQGFVHKPFDTRTERILDITTGLILLAVSWPVMLMVALAIVIEDRNFAVFYRQQRVGLNGRLFKVLKFRSMTLLAEPGGHAQWAAERETRVTRVGRFIRKARIDELPQIFNVLAGQMSFVGPRPERPEFVDSLAEQIPFYSERHRVKPGITGWAQLCYPYGASVADAREKLEFDLYYLKNHSVMLDLMILIQTVEIVLIGDGAR